MQIVRNARADRHAAYEEDQLAIVSLEQSERAGEFMRRCPLYAPTPLHTFDQLAARLGVSRIFVKDETSRLGLSSFKALGGAHAVIRRAAKFSGANPEAPANASPTFATATDGNHGISVAAGAWLTGSQAVIFVPPHVEASYAAAMRLFGARIVHVAGNYDEAVAQAAEVSQQNGWTLVSDTTDKPFDPVTRDVLSGYGVMVEECLEQLAEGALTHVFVQGGVGGLAAAFAGGFWQSLGHRCPTFVIVEPRSSDCLFQSARHGAVSDASGDLTTSMGMLSCGRPSRMAWTILQSAAEYFVAIEDASAAAGVEAFRAEPATRGRITTPSGAAGLGGLIEVASAADARKLVGLDEHSVVLAICSEQPPDLPAFERLIASRRAATRV